MAKAAAYPKQDRDLGLSRTAVGDRRLTAYDPGFALEIVERIADGELLKDICTAENGMPHKRTFLNWCARVPELQQAYRAAKELSAYSFEEDALTIARDTYQSPGTTQKVRAAEIAIAQLRWSASRRDPRQYGDKGNTQIVVPIHISTSLDLGESSDATTEQPDIYTIDLKSVVVQEQPAAGASLIPERDTHLPRKQVLTPRIPMDQELDRSKGHSKAGQNYRRAGVVTTPRTAIAKTEGEVNGGS